jgi:hypothetical protein
MAYMMPSATWVLWEAAGRPTHPDFTAYTGPCWWCGVNASGEGWPLRLLPDTFPARDFARAGHATHLCAACGWTLASGFALPGSLAAERLRERATLAWRGNRRTEVCIDGAPAQKRLVLELADGTIGLWTPATPKSAEDAWAAQLDRQRVAPGDVGPVRYVGAYPADRLAPGLEQRFFVWHHVTLPDPNGMPRWRPMTDAEKPAMRRHLLRDDLDGGHLGANVLSVEKKHCALFAMPEQWRPGAPRVVWFAGQSITYRAPTLARLIEAIEALLLAGVREEALVSGAYSGGAEALPLIAQHGPTIAKHRHRPLLDLALYLRRPVGELRGRDASP